MSCGCGSSTTCDNCQNCQCSCACPFYQQADVCEEDNSKKIFINRLSFGLCPCIAWNVPLCGQSALLSVPGVTNVPIGLYIFNPSFGYFQIQSIDSNKGIVGIVNSCTSGNSSPGTAIPKGTCFGVVAPPTSLSDNSTLFPFLAVDFTAPVNTACIDITLTTVNGIVGGNNIQIGTGIYFINQVKANNVVNICNHGQGITIGTAVIAKDTFGNYVYPIATIYTNTCSSTPGTAPATILVCNGVSTELLSGTTPGHVLTLVDNATGTASYQDSGVAALTAAIQPCTLAAGMNISTYQVTADGSDGFSAGTPATLNGSAPLTTSFGDANYVTVSNPSTCRNMTVSFDIDIEFVWSLAGNGVVNAAGTANTVSQIAEMKIDLSHWEGTTLGTIASPPGTPVASGQVAHSLQSIIRHDDGVAYPTLGAYPYHRKSTFVLAPLQQIKIATRGGMNATQVNGSPVITPNFFVRQNFFGIAL